MAKILNDADQGLHRHLFWHLQDTVIVLTFAGTKDYNFTFFGCIHGF